jgi:hypothetical protein
VAKKAAYLRQIDRCGISKLFTVGTYKLLKERAQKCELEQNKFPVALPPLTQFPLKEVRKNDYKLTDVKLVKDLIKTYQFNNNFCINKCINQLYLTGDEIREAHKKDADLMIEKRKLFG